MPRRWLSLRTHKDEPISTVNTSDGFDFAFGVDSPSARSSFTSHDLKRPFIFGSDPGKQRRKPDLTLLTERPPSSRASSRFNGSHSATLSESSCIGMAFGSPLHPPHNFAFNHSNMSPSSHCLLESSTPSRSPSMKKWKKIRGLFKSASNSEKTSPLACHCQQQVETAAHKLGVPVHRTQWRNPRSPPNIQDGFDTYHAIPHTENYNERPKTSHGYDAPSFQRFMDAQPVPSLQVKIPGSPFDRYSVMFKNINATPQLTLHNRRSRTMEKLTPEPSPLHDNADVDKPGLRRRVTSPTTLRTTDADAHCPKPSNSTRYSLFPSTPTVSRPQSQHRPSNSSPSRPWTAPGQALPPRGESPSPPKRQIGKSASGSQLRLVASEKELPLSSPPAIPETRNASNHSRSSSTGEIFFDVKSFRGSNEVNQYEMTRPGSAELQVARSKSNARRKMQRQSSIASMLEEVQGNPVKSTSAQIDDTIALVESLTSASALAVASTKAAETVSPRKLSSQHQQVTAAPVSDADLATTNREKRKSRRLKPEGLNVGVPSPVLESIEEMTPRTVSSRHSIALITEGPAVARLDHIAPRTRANSNDTKVPRSRLMQALPFPHPPVPVKDSRFIPLSRYAPKHTAEDLVRQTGLRPLRPTRSNTDDLASYNHSASVFRRQFPTKKSCTMPSILVPNIERHATSSPKLSGRRSSPHINQEMPMVVAYVKPSAEVSVARTISLSRKASATITVSKQSSRSTPKLTSHSEENVTERKVVERLPVLLEVNSKHRPGLSQNAVLELETCLSSSPGSSPSTNDFARTLDVFPTPPMATV